MNKQKMIFLLPLIFVVASLIGCATSLQNAIGNGDVATARKLIAEGADINLTDSIGSTPLHYAASSGNKQVAELLIAKGAEINVKSDYGHFTPLWMAAAGGKKAVVELLIAKGANPNMADYQGKSPRRIAEESGHTEIARLLKEAEEEGPRRVEASEVSYQEESRFMNAAQDYRNATVRPTLPEEARKFKVQAEGAVRDKKFEDAAELYGKALNIAPWWPEGHFNRAIVLGESRFYLGAVREMKRYLALVPNAPDARAAQDKIYEWERKAGK